MAHYTAHARWYHTEYLWSPHWQHYSALERERAGHCCEHPGCRNTQDLEVHHINYCHWYSERPGIDTIVLCRHHHQEEHDRQAERPHKTWAEIIAILHRQRQIAVAQIEKTQITFVRFPTEKES